MKRYLIATHGEMASGMQSTLKLLAGQRDDIQVIDAYVEKNESISQKLEELFVDSEDTWIVFTDILSGSVNREVIPFINEKVHVITGFNLPLLLELLFIDEVTDSIIEDKIIEARNQLQYVNKIIRGVSND